MSLFLITNDFGYSVSAFQSLSGDGIDCSACREIKGRLSDKAQHLGLQCAA